MRMGLIGLGSIAPFFARAIDADPGMALTAVCDRDEARLVPYAARGIAGYADAGHLLDSGLVDAVAVTLPNDQHAGVVEAALRRGLHVCCEKPLTIRLDDALRLQERARRAGVTLFTAFHRRYNRNLARLRAELPDLAGIRRVTARYHERIEEHTGDDRWYLDLGRCGGGCAVDNGPNALDAVRHLVGGLVLVDATLGDVRSGVEYCAELVLRTREGAVPVEIALDWALPTGEIKDVSVELRDGRTLTADLLAGFEGFKASLDHEYRGILADFLAAARAGCEHGADGVAAVALVEEAYRIGRRKEHRLRMRSKAPLRGRMLKLMYHARDDRGMRLAEWASRCVRAGEVHELVTTTDRAGAPGGRIDRVGFLGFVEFDTAGVIERGDELRAAGRPVGTVLGFDECHAPNHYNILVHADRQLTAAELDLRVGGGVEFAERSHAR